MFADFSYKSEANRCSGNRGYPNRVIRVKFSPDDSPIDTMPKTRVNQGSNGQYKVTVPKGIAEAMELEGKRLDWKVKSAGKLEVTVTDE